MTAQVLTSALSLISISLILLGCGIDRSSEGKRGVVEGSQFLVSSIRASEVIVSKISSMGIPEEKLFNLQACVQDRLTLSPIIDREFRVWAEGDVVNLKTDIRGCMTWQENHSFNYLEPEAYFRMVRTVEAVSAFSGKEVLQLKINPWKDGSSAILDSRYDQTPTEVEGQPISFRTKISRNGGKISSLKIKSVSFHLRRFRPDLYQLNPDLSLQVVHEYEFKTTVQFLRRTLSGQVTETPFSGRMKVHGYLTKTPVAMDGQIKDLIATFNDEVEIFEDGIIQHPLLMRILDPIAYSHRAYFYITLEPIDESNLTPINLMGLDDPHGPFNVHLRPVDQDIVDLFTKHQDLIAMKAIPLYKNLIDNSGMSDISAKTDTVLTELAKDLGSENPKAEFSPTKAKKICAALFPTSAEKASRLACDCGSIPQGLYQQWVSCRGVGQLTTQIRDVVLQTESPLQILSGPVSESLSVSASMEKSFSDSTDYGRRAGYSLGAKFSAGLGFGFDALEKYSMKTVKAPISLGVSFDASGEAFYSNSWVWSDSAQEGSSQRSAVNYEGESYQLGYRAQVKRCAFFQIDGSGQARRMVCSEPFVRDVQQTYYFINMNLNKGSVITDAAAQDEGKHFVVRGKAAYELLKKNLADKNIKILYDRVQAKDLVLQNRRLTEEYPGLLLPFGDD